MQFLKVLAGLAALGSYALAQTGSSGKYCDSLTSICYQSYTDANGISFRFALPPTTAAPFDAVLQIVAPIKYTWVGFSWGGQMAYVPLTVGWPNVNKAIYSSRMAYGLILPNAYDKAEYTYLKGTGANSTHWTLTVRCKGCSVWNDVDGKQVTIDPSNKAVKFAHAYSTRAVSQPSNNGSSFYHHDAADHWTLDLSQAQSSSFNQWVAANTVPDAPSSSSSLPSSPSTTTALPPSTTLTRTTSVVPSGTGMPTSCAGAPAPRFSSKTAAGWRAVKVAGGLTNPRGLVIDTSGNVLVVENGKGIVGYSVDSMGCVTSNKTILAQMNLNHGIELSPDGKTLYASSMTKAWSWSYDASTMSVSGSSKDLVMGMYAGGHTTRTLVVPPKHPNLLVVSHGSNDNWDYAAADMKTERAVIKVFDLTNVPTGGYDYVTGGYQMGYGLRNEVGLAIDNNGMLWGVENGCEEIRRTIGNASTDIHDDNPGEELNYFGDPSTPNTQWYGYPWCHSVWKPSDIKDKTMSIGDQIVLEPNSTFNDDMCKNKSRPAKLVMQAHSVPLDSKFSLDNKALYVSFHGSSDRTTPTGYKVIEIPFTQKAGDRSYNPTAALSDSSNGYNDIWTNVDVLRCTMLDCFRPVGITVNKAGRLYVTSDGAAEGELYLLGKV